MGIGSRHPIARPARGRCDHAVGQADRATGAVVMPRAQTAGVETQPAVDGEGVEKSELGEVERQLVSVYCPSTLLIDDLGFTGQSESRVKSTGAELRTLGVRYNDHRIRNTQDLGNALR
ncbi:hypothetical protein ACXR2U_00570 [Jatrophihabitans sp. YIM 134969]